jgi:hypothetical protein
VPEGGKGALQHLLVVLRAAVGFVDEVPSLVEAIRGEKAMGSDKVEVGFGHGGHDNHHGGLASAIRFEFAGG